MNRESGRYLKKYKVEIVSISISVLIGVIYSMTMAIIVGDFSDAVSHGVNLTILLAILSLLIQQVKRVPRIEELVQMVKYQETLQKDLVFSINGEKQRANELLTHLHSRNELVHITGRRILDDYMDSFKRIEHGFEIKGAYWVMRSYAEFWKNLVAKQRLVGPDPNACLVVRVTHSSDIKLLHPDEEEWANQLILHQHEFIKAGGIVLRILIGKELEMNSHYAFVKEKCESIGVEVKYVCAKASDNFSYDFLWLADDNYVVQWYTNVSGDKLDRCEIRDQEDESVISQWRMLFYRAAEEDSAFRKLPKYREVL